jgi:hypothetical protein
MDTDLTTCSMLATRINRSTNPLVIENAVVRMRDIVRHGHPMVAKYAARYLANWPGKSS